MLALLGALWGPAAFAQTATMYTYDTLGRVTSATYSNGTTVVTYTYDALGNRTAHLTCSQWKNFNWGQVNWCSAGSGGTAATATAGRGGIAGGAGPRPASAAERDSSTASHTGR